MIPKNEIDLRPEVMPRSVKQWRRVIVERLPHTAHRGCKGANERE